MKKKALPVLLLLLLLGLAIGGGGYYLEKIRDKDKKEIITLRIWVDGRSALYLPVYIAQNEGYFIEQGIKVKLVTRPEEPAANPYIKNIVDVILSDPVEFLYQRSVNPASPRAVLCLTSRDETFLLGREKESFVWENLKGKNIICFPPETGPGFSMEKILRGEDLLPQRDLGLYYRIPEDLRLGVFKSGSGSYIQLRGYEALQAESSGAGLIVASLGDKTGFYPSAVGVVWPEVIRDHPEAVQGFVNAVYKAQLWLQHEPDLADGAVKSHLKQMDKKLSQDLIQKYLAVDMWKSEPQWDKKAFDELSDLLNNAGQLVAPVLFKDAVDNSFTDVARKSITYIPKEEREKNWLQKLWR